jgi:hypothetical protein
MKHIGQMILLVRGAPHSYAPACLAEVDRLIASGLRHFVPVAVADPAKVLTDIADNHTDIRSLELITHYIHLCITRLAAQHCAGALSWRVTFAGKEVMSSPSRDTHCCHALLYRA